MKTLHKISLVACFFAFSATHGLAQTPAIQKKMEALLQKNVPGTKVLLSKENNLMDIQQKSASSSYDFKVPWLTVDSKFTLRAPNLKDTVYSVEISCAQGVSCITLFENTKEHHTKSIMLSFNDEKDAKTYADLMKKLKKSK